MDLSRYGLYTLIVSKRLTDELGLVTQHTDFINLVGFNEPDGKLYESDAVSFCISFSDGGDIKMQAS